MESFSVWTESVPVSWMLQRRFRRGSRVQIYRVVGVVPLSSTPRGFADSTFYTLWRRMNLSVRKLSPSFSVVRLMTNRVPAPLATITTSAFGRITLRMVPASLSRWEVGTTRTTAVPDPSLTATPGRNFSTLPPSGLRIPASEPLGVKPRTLEPRCRKVPGFFLFKPFLLIEPESIKNNRRLKN